MKNLRTYDIPVQHIKGAVIQWHMNVWESSILDREKLKKEFNYTDEQITELVNQSRLTVHRSGTKPAQRLVTTKLYKSRKMAERWWRRYTAESFTSIDA
jgi:hypothetical protein